MRRLTLFLGLVALATTVACGTDQPTNPAPIDTPPTVADPPPAAPGQAPPPISTNTWESNGLRVTVIGDQWGPGTCHDNGGTRTLLIENIGEVARYSRLAAYADDVPMCATQKSPTGKPNFDGPSEVKPGEAITVAYGVTFPKGTDGVCTLQVDDCWGPGGIGECGFVVGDAFKVPDAQCKKVCVPGEWTEVPGSRLTRRTPWGECPAADVTEICYECREVRSSWKETNGCEKRNQSSKELERREKDCPACQDNPAGSVVAHTGANPYRASATFEDSGEWTLRISASSRESECASNQPDYWKRTVRKSLKCDERGSLDTTYSWSGHAAEWWRSVLYRNGAVVDQTACVRNPFNGV